MHDPANEVRQLQLTLSDYAAACAPRGGWDWASTLTNPHLLVAHLNEHVIAPIAESAEREWQRSIEASSPRKELRSAGGAGAVSGRGRRRLGCPVSPRSSSVSSPVAGLVAGLLQAAPRLMSRSPSKSTPRGVPDAVAAVQIPAAWGKPHARGNWTLFSDDDGYAGEVESAMESDRGAGAECGSAGAAELPTLLSHSLYLAATTSGAVAAMVAVAAAFAIARA